MHDAQFGLLIAWPDRAVRCARSRTPPCAPSGTCACSDGTCYRPEQRALVRPVVLLPHDGHARGLQAAQRVGAVRDDAADEPRRVQPGAAPAGRRGDGRPRVRAQALVARRVPGRDRRPAARAPTTSATAASGSTRARSRTATRSGPSTTPRDVERDVDNLVRAKGASRMAITDLGKFRASCRTMVASNSAGASAKQAYDLLFPMLSVALAGRGARERRLPRVALLRHARARGRGPRRRTFTAKVLSGTVLSDQDLKNAMYVVGEDRATRNLAMEFADGDARAGAPRCSPRRRSTPRRSCAARTAARGSRATWARRFLITRAVSNEPLERFVRAFAAQGPAMAHAYLNGVAAVCSLAARRWWCRSRATCCPFSAQQTQTGEAGSRTAAALGRLVGARRGPRRDRRAHAAQRVDRPPLGALGALVGQPPQRARRVPRRREARLPRRL